MTKTILYPLTAATIARPTPVLPEVGSTIVPPGLQQPARSASSIISAPMRSLTRPARIEHLELGQNGRAQSGRQARQPHQRRVPNQTEDIGGDFHACNSPTVYPGHARAAAMEPPRHASPNGPVGRTVPGAAPHRAVRGSAFKRYRARARDLNRARPATAPHGAPALRRPKGVGLRSESPPARGSRRPAVRCWLGFHHRASWHTGQEPVWRRLRAAGRSPVGLTCTT